MKQALTNIDEADFIAGELLLIDKPMGWTSFDVVNKLRYALRRLTDVKKIKVGHSGTLDPMATGLLQICTGKMTKQIESLQGLPKCYTGTMKLGATTPSYDGETEEDHIFPTDHISLDILEEAKKQFLGNIEQVPPMFSAIKVDGQPLYKAARKGIVKEIKARPVTITRFELSDFELPEVQFLVDCSKGTYIRSLVHDLGKAVNSGSYLTALRRTKIGDYELDKAWVLDELIALLDAKTKEGGIIKNDTPSIITITIILKKRYRLSLVAVQID